ncbi:MAG: hypothetical protein HQK49_02700 [Oligoflexia bacterium]|nr:hypothetical protein [Oligoflexia bacterium]
MRFIQELRKGHDSQQTFFADMDTTVASERIFDHIVFGDNIWSLMLADAISKKDSSTKINVVNTKGNFEAFPISSNINLLRGENDIKVFNYVLKLLGNTNTNSEIKLESKWSSKFYKDHEFRFFNGRMKPTSEIQMCEKFFTVDHYGISTKSLFSDYFKDLYQKYSTTASAHINENSDSTSTSTTKTSKIKSIYSGHMIGEETFWPIELVDGTIVLTKKIYWELGVNEFFKLLKNKNLYSDNFHQFCSSSRRYHTLVMHFVSAKNITNERGTLFIPRSLTEDNGFFIGEFAEYDEQHATQDFVFFAFLNREEVIEDVSKIIRNLKRALKKVFPNIEKNIIRENIEVSTNIAGTQTDDFLFSEIRGEIPNVHFIGPDAPIDIKTLDDLQMNSNMGEFHPGEFHPQEISYLNRGLLAHLSCLNSGFLFLFLFSSLFLTSFLFYSENSYAGKARTESLGGDDVSYYYFDDPRNILTNPAHLNTIKDFIVFEWGNDADAVETGSSAPKGEGGFFKSSDFFIYGLYLGHDEGYVNRNDVINGTSASTPNFLYQDNSAEVFIAGNIGNEWGTSVKVSKSKDEQAGARRSQESMSVKFGTVMGNLSANLRLVLFDKSQGGSTDAEEFRNHMTLTLGASYSIENFIIYGQSIRDGYDYNAPAGGTEIISKKRMYLFGGGHSYQLSERAKMFVNVTYKRSTLDKTSAMTTTPLRAETVEWIIPLTLGMEAQVKDWLILRGSISQYILSGNTNGAHLTKTERSTTNVSSGASICLGKLKIEGLIGVGDTTSNSTKKGVLSLGNVLTRASMIYSF